MKTPVLYLGPVLILFSCTSMYVPQSSFTDGKNPNSSRIEGDYYHEKKLYNSSFTSIEPQSKKSKIFKRASQNEYVPQSTKKLELTKPDSNFIGYWIVFADNEVVGDIKLNDNNKGIHVNSENIEYYVSWEHDNNTIYVGTPYRYRYYSQVDEISELWHSSYKYRWINTDELLLTDNEDSLVLKRVE